MESLKTPICSFCRKPASETRRILPGPDCAICESCVTFGEQLLREQAPEGKKDATCSFCGKTSDQVEILVYGPEVNICNRCIAFARKQLESG
jgi:ATP-dependent protease Clp ATPase subunit